MRITESQLRRVIRDVISESNRSVDPNILRNTLESVQIAAMRHFISTDQGKDFLGKLCELARNGEEQACRDILQMGRCDLMAVEEICSNPEMVEMGLPAVSDASGYID